MNGAPWPRPGFPEPKLNVHQVRWILAVSKTDRRQRRAAGFVKLTYGLRRRLAAHFGVSHETIRDIIDRTSWKSVRVYPRKGEKP